jgi:ribA/ribD-fused uncharacterized protein
MIDTINFAFSETFKPYNKLSNFWPCDFIYESVAYRSAEHAYQAAKTDNLLEKARVRVAVHPRDAKKLGSGVTVRSTWDSEKIFVMRRILRCKFTQCLDMRALLVETGESKLVHAAPWDSFWGSGRDGLGTNHLGFLLMQLREEINKERSDHNGKELVHYGG